MVVPAYNEEAAIAATVQALREWLEAHGEPWEILVMDNASEDRTAEIVRELADDERVRLLRNERNRGKGYSMRRGMLEATGELRLHCDADCATSLPSLPHMLELVREYDVVVGSRLAAGQYRSAQSISRSPPVAAGIMIVPRSTESLRAGSPSIQTRADRAEPFPGGSSSSRSLADETVRT